MSHYSDIAHLLMGKVLADQTEGLCMAGLTFAELNGAATFTVARASEKSSARSIAILFAGPIPDDLVQMLGRYTAGLSQDLKNEGKIRTIHEG
jgi:hypothetical protein